MARVLVTGGAGFIGSHIAKHLISDGHDVTIVDNLSRGFKRSVPVGAEFISLDIRDESKVHDLFSKKLFEYVVHTAAFSAVGFSHVAKRLTNENNVLASINLINASVNHSVKCFLFISSISVYNPCGKGSLTEDSLDLRPVEPYGSSKLSIEQELRITSEKFGLRYVIVRPFNVYGEGQHIGDSNRNVVGIFIRKALNGEPLTVIGDGSNKLAFTHIDDLTPVVAKLPFDSRAHNEIFNIGSDIVYTLNDLAGKVRGLAGGGVSINHINPSLKQDDLVCSIEKAKSLLGYVPSVSFDEGLKRMWEWAKGMGSIRGSILI